MHHPGESARPDRTERVEAALQRSEAPLILPLADRVPVSRSGLPDRDLIPERSREKGKGAPSAFRGSKSTMKVMPLVSLALLTALPVALVGQDREADGRPMGFPDAAAYVQGYADGVGGVHRRAPTVAVAYCPGESEWHGQVVRRLMALDVSRMTEQRMASLAASLAEGVTRCGFDGYAAWYERALPATRDGHTARQVTRGMLVDRRPSSVDALTDYGLDAANDMSLRHVVLMELQRGLSLDQRGELLLSLIERGDVPSSFMMHQLAELLWGPDVDAFVRRGLEVIEADREGADAGELLFQVAAASGDERVSRETALAVLARLDRYAAAPDADGARRSAAARWAPLIRLRLGRSPPQLPEAFP